MADQKPKRPRDMNKLAKSIADIATGEDEDHPKEPPKKVPARKKGAEARLAKLTKEERADIARAAALARWKKS